MIKPDRWIREWGQNGGVTPFEESQVNSASYDVVLASTMEYVRVPRIVACDLKLKSTLGRLWINHSLAGWCDPGFEGEITLELQNLGPQPFVLEAGRRIAQLIFIAMESEPDVAYGEPGSSSHYQGQRGTTPARR
jgi:dCTP deaminase